MPSVYKACKFRRRFRLGYHGRSWRRSNKLSSIISGRVEMLTVEVVKGGNLK